MTAIIAAIQFYHCQIPQKAKQALFCALTDCQYISTKPNSYRASSFAFEDLFWIERTSTPSLRPAHVKKRRPLRNDRMKKYKHTSRRSTMQPMQLIGEIIWCFAWLSQAQEMLTPVSAIPRGVKSKLSGELRSSTWFGSQQNYRVWSKGGKWHKQVGITGNRSSLNSSSFILCCLYRNTFPFLLNSNSLYNF